jgi:hypothetical protein
MLSTGLTADVNSVAIDPVAQQVVYAAQRPPQPKVDRPKLQAAAALLAPLRQAAFFAALQTLRAERQEACALTIPIFDLRRHRVDGSREDATRLLTPSLSFSLASLDAILGEAQECLANGDADASLAPVLCEVYPLSPPPPLSPQEYLASAPLDVVRNPVTSARKFIRYVASPSADPAPVAASSSAAATKPPSELYSLNVLHGPPSAGVAAQFAAHLNAHWRPFSWQDLVNSFAELQPRGEAVLDPHLSDPGEPDEDAYAHALAEPFGPVGEALGSRTWAFPPAVPHQLSSTSVCHAANVAQCANPLRAQVAPNLSQWPALSAAERGHRNVARVLVPIDAGMVHQYEIYQRVFSMRIGCFPQDSGLLALKCIQSLRSWQVHFGMQYIYHPLLFRHLLSMQTEVTHARLGVAVCGATELLAHVVPESLVLSGKQVSGEQPFDLSSHALDSTTKDDAAHYLLQWPAAVLENITDQCDGNATHRQLLQDSLTVQSDGSTDGSTSEASASATSTTYVSPVRVVFYLLMRFGDSPASGQAATNNASASAATTLPLSNNTHFIYPLLHCFATGHAAAAC